MTARSRDQAEGQHHWRTCDYVQANHDGPCIEPPGAELARLRAENERLRAALGWLVALKDGPRDYTYRVDKPHAWNEARAALAPVSTDTDEKG